MTQITVIWSDRDCADLDDYNIHTFEIQLTEQEIVASSTDHLVRAAIIDKNPNYSPAHVTSLVSSYGLVGIAKGTIDWIV